jgi:beta-lactamase class A
MTKLGDEVLRQYQAKIYDKFVGQKLSDKSVVPISSELRDSLRSLYQKLGNGGDATVLAGMTEAELEDMKQDIGRLAQARETPSMLQRFQPDGGDRTRPEPRPTDQNVAPPTSTVVATPRPQEKVEQSSAGTNTAQNRVPQASRRPTLNLTDIVEKYHLHSVSVQELSTGESLGSHRATTPPISPASTIKLPIALLALEKIRKGELTQLGSSDGITAEHEAKLPSQLTPLEAVQRMLRDSNNTATNMLVQSMGGPEKVTQELRRMGFSQTTFANYLSLPNAQVSALNQSSAAEVNEAMRRLFNDPSREGRLARQWLTEAANHPDHPYEISRRVADKWGGNSKVWGDAAIIEVDGKRYAVSLYVETRSGGKRSKQHVEDAMNEIVKRLEKPRSAQ